MKDVIIACDFPDARTCLTFLDSFADTRKPFVKIGMELFYGAGPDIVRELKARDHKVFLDLKLHDIPNTVRHAMKVLGKLGVDLTNVHAGGGTAMMGAARLGLDDAGSDAELIAVTQLTSTSQEVLNGDLLVAGEMADVVTHYAQNAKKAGLSGVVCSPWEAKAIHESCGADFLTVTPGIRFAEDSVHDQKRIATPAKARELTSDYIVVGRSITAAEDPVVAYARALEDFCPTTTEGTR